MRYNPSERRWFIHLRQRRGRHRCRRTFKSRIIIAHGHGSRFGVLAASPLLRVSRSAARPLRRRRGWTRRSAWTRRSTVAQQPNLVCCSTALSSCLGSSMAASYKLNSFAAGRGGHGREVAQEWRLRWLGRWCVGIDGGGKDRILIFLISKSIFIKCNWLSVNKHTPRQPLKWCLQTIEYLLMNDPS